MASGKSTWRLLLGILVCLLPMLLAYFSPLQRDTAVVYMGVLPAFVALTLGLRVALVTAVGTGAVMFTGLLLGDLPIVAAMFLAGLGAAVAWAQTRGWRGPATYVATQGAIAAVAAPVTKTFGGGVFAADSLANAASVALITTVAGVWVAVLGSLTLPSLRAPAERHPWNHDLTVFATTLGVLLGVCTVIIMRFSSGGNAWWILLTILVSVAPVSRRSIPRAMHRAAGTILGGVIAAVLVLSIDDRSVLLTIGLCAAVASAVAYVRAPYWVFAAMLTLALALLTFPTGHVLRVSAERVGYTLLAAVLVMAVALGIDLIDRRIMRRRDEDAEEAP